MSTIEAHSQQPVNDLLHSVAHLETEELEQFVSKVLFIRAKRMAQSVPVLEAELLEEINQGLSPDRQQRYNDLVIKRQAETLIPEEHNELLTLINHIEQADVERVQALTRLAQLRRVPVPSLMRSLGINPPVYG